MVNPVVEVREPGRTPLRLVLTGPLVVGRDCEGLLLTDDQVSRRHAQLRPVAGGVEVSDLGSTNGTFVDRQPISGATMLDVGGQVLVGTTVITVMSFNPIEPAVPDLTGRGAATTVMTAIPGTASSDGPATSIDHVSALAASDLPYLAEQEHHHGTITIVFSDIEGSTELVERVGDRDWFGVLALHNDVVRRQVRRFGGAEVKNQGDGFMLTFPSARRAVQAMTGVQRELSAADVMERTSQLRVRVGMHTGEVIVDDGGDLFGHHVHFASRVAGQAVGGEVVVSSLTRALLETRGDIRFDEPRDAILKGFVGTHTIHPVIWRSEDPA